ncbi:hypothetical protein EVJ58_g11105 [Rhodofomes roseus]|uniref:Uncharacterized protein n=1 Tax=Rhodofomes roseus TaxID=34475 RepID=A0A4Y9XP43_9APHY|nr:hypothetical protein EVJ58_g11105 [Rhodofomes roseus]
MACTPQQSTAVIGNHENAGPSADDHYHLARQYLAVAAEATPELVAEQSQVREWAKHFCLAVEYARAVGVTELEIAPHVNAACDRLSQSFPNAGDNLPEWAESALRAGFDRMRAALQQRERESDIAEFNRIADNVMSLIKEAAEWAIAPPVNVQPQTQEMPVPLGVEAPVPLGVEAPVPLGEVAPMGRPCNACRDLGRTLDDCTLQRPASAAVAIESVDFDGRGRHSEHGLRMRSLYQSGLYGRPVHRAQARKVIPVRQVSQGQAKVFL